MMTSAANLSHNQDTRERASGHMWHPMTAPGLNTLQAPLVIASADGIHVTDTNGKTYIDGSGGMWNVNVGHNRPEIKAAIAAQMDRISYCSTFGNMTTEPVIALSTRLAELMQVEDMTRFMFSTGGSDAVETAFKLARQYWLLEGQPRKSKIISLRNGYHGLHWAGTAASGSPVWKAAYEPGIPGFLQVEGPYPYRNPWTSDPQQLGEICAGILEREIVHQGPDSVAAFIAEPVQGAGGLIVPPDNYWPLLRAVCDRHNVLLIADEVITGFGRTGSMFGSRLWGVKPDLMCLAKGINSGYVPMGATAVGRRVAQAWEREHPMAPIMHGYTGSGHPLACAAALANLDIVIGEDLPRNAAIQGAHLLERLQSVQERSDCVGDVRGAGLMVCVEFVKDRTSKQPHLPGDRFLRTFMQQCMQRGLLVRMQANKLYLSPPLIIKQSAVDQIADVIEEAITSAMAMPDPVSVAKPC
jgi:putrescine aminotransferase